MATFSASFTASQSIDGKTITITDTSNYGVDSTHTKANFQSRQLIVTRGDNVNSSVTYNFPYTGTPDSTQDTYSLPTITQDYSYSIMLKLTYQDGVTTFTSTNPVLATQYTNLNKLQMLNQVQPCDCNDSALIDSIDKVNIALQSASQRSSVGDISGAQQLISYAYDTTLNYLNL